jgi:membrane associated rhomboid family serine protease
VGTLRPMSESRRPVVTAVVVVVTAWVSVVGLLDHSVVRELERRGGELGDGEPWRLVTSLLVHDSWLALVANLVLLGVLGVATERRHSRVEWATLYLSAGIVGELVGLTWQPHGAGNSVAALGLAGALVVDALRRDEPAFLALGYTTVVLVTLGAADLGGIVGAVIAILAYVAAGAGFAATRQGSRVPTSAGPALGVVALVVAAALVALGNIHGPALLTGVTVASVWEVGLRGRASGRTGRRRRRR